MYICKMYKALLCPNNKGTNKIKAIHFLLLFSIKVLYIFLIKEKIIKNRINIIYMMG